VDDVEVEELVFVVLLTLEDEELDVVFTVEELRDVLVAEERDDAEDKLVLLELELLEAPVVPFLI
jgi:hypothetical protein